MTTNYKALKSSVLYVCNCDLLKDPCLNFFAFDCSSEIHLFVWVYVPTIIILHYYFATSFYLLEHLSISGYIGIMSMGYIYVTVFIVFLNCLNKQYINVCM